VGVAIALVSVGLSPSPADANAKHLAEQIGCAALGIWRGEVEVGESASAVPAEAVALAWRTFKPVKDRLPRAAWRSFDKDRAFKALVDWCQAHYPRHVPKRIRRRDWRSRPNAAVSAVRAVLVAFPTGMSCVQRSRAVARRGLVTEASVVSNSVSAYSTISS
jgi:hypothetical protein